MCVGSKLCGKLSARTVEIGLVPLGAFGMTAFMLDLALSRTGTAAVAGLDVAGFLQQPGAWPTVADLVGIGLFTGFFVVPLFALIQSRSPKSEMSRTFAARSEEHTSELHSLMRISYAVFCLKK